jgi:protein-S-isoprenylcysteine O-methyltransferase Ste14
VGAICVIFATKSAIGAAVAEKLPPATFRIYIAPLIFGLAPVINVLVSTVWHPQAGQPFHFKLEVPGWKLWVGILLVGVGAALVLFSKEEAESTKKGATVRPATPAVAAAPGSSETPR